MQLLGDWDRFGRWVGKVVQKTSSTSELMKKVGDYGVRSTRERIQRGVPPKNAPLTASMKRGNGTLRDSGALIKSIRAESSSREAEWGSDLIYARIHNEGGTITPKRSKNLAIPASKQSKAFMSRFGGSPRSCISGMRNAGWRVWTSRSGRAIMAKRKGGEMFVLFILKQSVRIPKRQYLDIDKKDENNVLEMTATHCFVFEGFTVSNK